MLKSLKHRLIDRLGLATKTDVAIARQNALSYCDHAVAVKVASLVKQELDRDERTLVVNVTVEVAAPSLDTNAIKMAVAKSLAKL